MKLPVIMVFWYVFPIILLFACNFIVQSLALVKKYKLKSPDLATPLLLMGIHAISVDTFKVSAVPYLLILIFLLGIGIAVSHAYYYGDIQYKRYFKMFWRIVFLLTLILYILLTILNIIQYV
ncbi:DUF3397 domain-containing protein [Vagococcus sp. BWB3-3]|uniref:DUF3397 domain-containing protein n=1 Tax=Vagococcus allomyrinae TaxID=2794353 RepID=A0A940SS43_9ENTE|nr:DUF3397 domain-containing protein [Vagococcus allomyrinae]MBP1041517.1 DUF3397 domain-containing protein [Vagococcus allomyrinae]